MADVDDVNNFSGRLRSQIELAQALETEDSDHIIRWAHSQDVADATLIDRLKNVRLASERAEKPLTEFDRDDLDALLDAFETGEHPNAPADGYADGTMRQYRQALKLYLRDELGREWAEDITIGAASRPPISPEKIFTSDEIDAMLEASENPRDTALIAFLTVTGQRITAALSLQRKHVNLDDRQGRIRLPDDAKGMKGASGPRPILWARPYIVSWLESHPVNSEEAPLFCTLKSGRRPKEDGGWATWEKGDPLTRSRVANMLHDVAEKAGLEAGKAKPHNFRHTAITRMRDQQIADDRIKFMVGVAPDSDILERYDQADNEKMLERIRQDHGIETEDVDVGQPSLEACNQCQTALRSADRFCPSCGMPIADEAASLVDSAASKADDSLATGDLTEAQLMRAIQQSVENNPEAIVGAVLEELS